MALFGLLKNKCFFCRTPIGKGAEHTANVKVPGYTGTFPKHFCSEEHATAYNKELENRPKRSGGGGCCG